MLGGSPWAVAVICIGLLTISIAEPAPTATSTYSVMGCPTSVGIVNGGFESGEISPWTEEPASEGTDYKGSLISPGYQSKYALRLQFPPGDKSYYIYNSVVGELCPGYYYNISYAWNWLHYTGFPGYTGIGRHGPYSCEFFVYAQYTHSKVFHYATKTPGWHYHSYVAQQKLSCDKVHANLVAGVLCAKNNETAVIPGLTILIDDLQITNAGRAPRPLPPRTCE